MISAIYRQPFSLDMPKTGRFSPGVTLADIGDRLLPRGFAAEQGFARINGHEINPVLWRAVRPKDGVVIEFGHHVTGGGDNSGKNVLGIVAALGLTALTGGIAAGAIFGGASSAVGAALGIGATAGAQLLAGGVGLIGSLLLNGLTPPPTLAGGSQADPQRNASATGNTLEPNGPMWRVVGERRVSPPLLSQPLITLDGQDEVAEIVCGLAGPHRLQDIRIGSAAADGMAGVEIETREGWPGDSRLRILTRYGYTTTVNSELPGHRVENDNQQQLDSSIDVAQAVPQAVVYATRQAPDEHQIQIAFPQGLGRPSNEGDQVRVPLRLRIRPSGGTWRNLPELHYRAGDIRLLRASIRLIWGDDGGAAAEASGKAGWVEARIASPAQTVAPETTGWTADSYFDAGSGDDYLTFNNLGTTAVQHVYTDRFEARIYLDPAEFTPGKWEVEVTRGCALREAVWSSSAYTVSGSVRDLFAYTGSGQIAFSREGLADTLAVIRSVSIWNDSPVQTDRVALIAVKARNVQLQEVSALAGGYVRDWGGSAWDTWTVSSNPAPHLRDIFVGRENMDPVPEAMIDDTDMMVPWRTRCAAAGYECNAIIQGQTVATAASIVAGCGFGRPYLSDVFGVVWDRDRSADSPVQLFTPRNARGLTMDKGNARLPDGLRVTFDDSAQDWTPRQITVWRSGANRYSGLTEQVRYEGIDTEAAARARAAYDLDVLVRRSILYSFDAPPEAIVARRGDLIAIGHDVLSEQHGYARVVAGGADAVTLDASVPLINEPDLYAASDLYAIADLWLAGLTSAAAIRRSDGTVDVVLLDCATGESADLAFAATTTHVPEGALIAVGPHTTEVLRLIVAGVAPQDGLDATVTCIDEAPELFA